VHIREALINRDPRAHAHGGILLLAGCYNILINIMAKFRKIIRIIWIIFGILFLLWMANSFRAQGFDKTVLESDQTVTVEATNQFIHFQPSNNGQPTGFIFFPGGMVQPEAYAPMSREIAEQGYNVFIVNLPLGSAPLESQQTSVMDQALEITDTKESIRYWVVGGHSRGAAIAARFAFLHGNAFDGLILIGTSHPKEKAFDLSTSILAVTKIYATSDGLASTEEVEANAGYLPDDTNWVLIEGGNHAQFGYYGSQLGDNAATISRERQQELTVDAILFALNEVQKE
jgi:predicted esterase